MKNLSSIIIIFIFLNYYLDSFADRNSGISQIPETIKSRSVIGEVTFSHKQHVTDYGAECNTCHHKINASKLDIPHKNYFKDTWKNCQLCHKEGISDSMVYRCSSCHKALSSNTADETQSSKVVIHMSCSKCHELGEGKKASSKCRFCHSGAKKRYILNY